MLNSIAMGILLVLSSILLSVNLVQGIRTAQKWYRRSMRAADQANMTASEIQRLLAVRSLRSGGWQ